jgi:opacity protein-like surface antigen
MQKKILFLFFATAILHCHAQFVNGIGLFGAGMASRHKYKDENSPERLGSHKSKYLLRPAGGIVADFGRGDYGKWRTEFEYNTMGAKEISSTDGAEKKFRNKLDYISWNNFLKVQTETYSGYPYILLGARCQYLFKNKPEIYQSVLNQAKKFHFSWDVGAGFEFMAYGPVRFFTEYHLVNDLPSLYNKEKLKVRNLTHELRIGLMYKFRKKTDNCNAPIYNDPY